MPTIDELFSTAMTHHRAGRLDQAVMCYRRVLEINPNMTYFATTYQCNNGTFTWTKPRDMTKAEAASCAALPAFVLCGNGC